MRAMDPAYERPHICRRTRTRNEYKIALKSLAAEAFSIEKIPWPRYNALRGKQDDVQRHEQARRGSERCAQRNANGPAAGNSRKRLGDSDIGASELFIGWAGNYVWQVARNGKNFWREPLACRDHDAARPFRRHLECFEDRRGRRGHALNSSGRIAGVR